MATQRSRPARRKRGAKKATRSTPARGRSARGRSARGRAEPRGHDAVSLLKADHRNVEAMFDRFQRTRGNEPKRRLAKQLCEELKVHTKIEEALFYPAVREAIDDDDLMNEAKIEHASAKDLIEQIEGSSPDDDEYDALVSVLSEYIKHHVKEEEGDMFKQARASGLDLVELGRKMKERRQQLTAKRERERPRGRLASLFALAGA